MCQVQLWSLKTGEQIVCFYHAERPVFTLDCKYLLYVDSGRTLITYCLSRMAPLRYLACQADQLLVLPVKHRLVLMTNWSASNVSGPRVSLWDFHEGRELVGLAGVAAGGIRDISKDGVLAVDARLQVFELDSGTLKSHIAECNLSGSEELSFVRLTDDGQYVVWVDKLSVKVGRVSDGLLIAHACTHERLTSLCMLDHGYMLVVGREDGRILMMTLLPHQQSRAVLRTHTADERCSILRGGNETCCDEVKSSFDLIYQCKCQSVRDGELQRATESLRNVLAQRAKAPLLSTAVSKTSDAAVDKYRRSYSQLTSMSEGRPLTGASSYQDIAGSSIVNRRSADEQSVDLQSDASVLVCDATLMQRRSHSVADLMSSCTLKKRDAGLESPGSVSKFSPAVSPPVTALSPPVLRTPANKLLGCLWDIGANIRRRKKYRRPAPAADSKNRDRMPSI